MPTTTIKYDPVADRHEEDHRPDEAAHRGDAIQEAPVDAVRYRPGKRDSDQLERGADQDRDEHLIALQAEVLCAVRDGEHREQRVHDVRTDS
jgi:hypothetical protein